MAPAAVLPPYVPSTFDTINFWEHEKDRQRTKIEVPAGFPAEIDSPLAWTGAEIQHKSAEWTTRLTDEEVAAIEAAADAFQATYDDYSDISNATFVLPAALSSKLRKLSDQIYKGYGFQIVQGLDPSKYTQRQNALIYAGISAHICPQRGFVSPQGGVFTHILNVQGDDPNPAEAEAPAFGKTPLSFHTDNCEVMAFYLINHAARGGETQLSSSWKVYNELAQKRPDVLHTLSKRWCQDTYKSYDSYPVRQWRPLTMADSDRVLLRFSRYGTTGWQHKRNPELPTPTQAQCDAIDAVHFTAEKHAITLPLIKGDLLYVNDMVLMHGRKAFDEEGEFMKRYIIKMFLRDPDQNWTVPPEIIEENMWKYEPNQPDGSQKEVWEINHGTASTGLACDNG